MGRLRRDRRAMGLFPSNFVQVLDDSFQPKSRATSPMPITSRASSPNPSPQKQKSVFRKPFQAYTQASSPKPAADPRQFDNRSRGPSPSPSRQPSYTQPPSAANSPYHSRAPSPAPSVQYRAPSRNASYNPHQDFGSSPPPPAPPPHRVAYVAPSRATPSPVPSMNDRFPTISRGYSPAPPSPSVPGLTPSPLRDAMDDVMSSLHNMALRRDAPSPSPEPTQTPLDPWSPESFEEFRTKAHPQARSRPLTSLGLGGSQQREDDYQVENGVHGQRGSSQEDYNDGPPNIGNYVERMESRLRSMQLCNHRPPDELFLSEDRMGPPPAPPPKHSQYLSRPQSSISRGGPGSNSTDSDRRLKHRKSAYELGRDMLDRTMTTKSSATNSSSGVQSTTTNGTSSTQRTNQSIMSGHSAGGFSATSAGSLARRKGWGSIGKRRPVSVADNRQGTFNGSKSDGATARSQTSSIGISYHSSHDSRPASAAPADWSGSVAGSDGLLGGLTSPKPRRSGFFKKLVESAKTGAASARSSIATGQTGPPRSPVKSLLPNGVTAIAGGKLVRETGSASGASGIDWVQIRRDVNRSNSLSRNERSERAERCQMMDYPVIAPVDELLASVEGDEGLDGLPIEQSTNFNAVNFQLVDKSARFVNSVPPMTNPASLAQGYVCRPYRSDVQRLRAIFTWISEKVAWEEDFEGEMDSRRVIQARRGCAEEIAVLVLEMCSAMGLHAEVVRGYLKAPGDALEFDSIPRPNHWWNAVLADGEWRIIDCSLASPTNPKRARYSSAGAQVAESGWFLTRPSEMCYTHIPSLLEQQHICPPIAPDILLALPCACPPYFQNDIRMLHYDTSLLHIENLELVQIQFTVPYDIEVFAEVTAHSYARDADGDLFESGDTITKRALAQADWLNGQKQYTVKALLPSDEGHGTLKVYAGKRGLMHSIKDNPHPLAFALPISHTGINPPYDFLLRHPTPHAQRHDLYVAQPQCARLAVNNTFVFAVRQHPSSPPCTSPSLRSTSPLPFMRPSSAMSMTSASASVSDYFSQTPSNASNQQQQQKPAKLAIQAPSGKILRLMRKSEQGSGAKMGLDEGEGGTWETVIKIGERGTWRGLVLADRSARWCVFGEWDCI